jgi:hypothetical protein
MSQRPPTRVHSPGEDQHTSHITAAKAHFPCSPHSQCSSRSQRRTASSRCPCTALHLHICSHVLRCRAGRLRVVAGFCAMFHPGAAGDRACLMAGADVDVRSTGSHAWLPTTPPSEPAVRTMSAARGRTSWAEVWRGQRSTGRTGGTSSPTRGRTRTMATRSSRSARARRKSRGQGVAGSGVMGPGGCDGSEPSRLGPRSGPPAVDLT